VADRSQAVVVHNHHMWAVAGTVAGLVAGRKSLCLIEWVLVVLLQMEKVLLRQQLVAVRRE
jgi:hypothetical protein